MTGAGPLEVGLGCTATAFGAELPDAWAAPLPPAIPEAYPSSTSTMPTSVAATISSR
jgi:hypothetical protein